MKEIGNQYSKDDTMDKTGFRKRARLHQSKYRAEVLNVDYCRDEGDDYGNRLSKDDGLKGLNFYNGFSIFDEVQKRNKNKYDKGLHSDMLRSEHTPFNLFVPFRQDKVFATKVFNDFFDNTIESIYISDDFNKFIEYAPSPRKK